MPNDSRTRMALWFVFGTLTGLSLTVFSPAEPVAANSTDRSTQFAMATGPVGGILGMTDPLDGVFTLDFLTGDLRGAVLNRQVGKFTAAYYRNIIQDFNLDPKAEPHFAIVTGNAQLTGQRSVTYGAGVVYVAELSSGMVRCYAYPWREINRPVPVVPFVPIDGFQFRKPDEKD